MRRLGLVVIAFALLATACGDDSEQAVLEDRIADLESQLAETSSGPAASGAVEVADVPPSTSVTTTTRAPTDAELAIPYFEALAEGDWVAARELSLGSAHKYAEFWREASSLSLSYSVQQSSVTTQGEDSLEVCTDSLNAPYDYEVRCFTVAEVGFMGDQVSWFTLNGQSIIANNSLAPLANYGDGEFTLLYRWGVIAPWGSIALLETHVASTIDSQYSIFLPLIPDATMTSGVPAVSAQGIQPSGWQTQSGGPPTTEPGEEDTILVWWLDQQPSLKKLEMFLTVGTTGSPVDQIVYPANTEPLANWEVERLPGDLEAWHEDQFAVCGSVPEDRIAKDPTAIDGCIELYGSVLQFDSITGPCALLVLIRQTRSSRNYDYTQMALIEGTAGACTVEDAVDNDDLVRIWASTDGTYTYQTVAGGTATVPKLRPVRVIELEER